MGGFASGLANIATAPIKAIGSIVGGVGEALTPKIPGPPPPPQAPTPGIPKVDAELEKARAEVKSGRGRADTLLTGGAGLSDDASVSKRVLLGA